MKKMIIALIKLYKLIPGPWHNTCRHIPTCSTYALDAIEEYGTIKGVKLSIKRIIRCNPLGTYGYDPVIKKENNNEKNI